MSVSDSFSRLSQPGMLALSTSGSLSASPYGLARRGDAPLACHVHRTDSRCARRTLLAGSGACNQAHPAVALGPAVRRPAGLDGRVPDRRAALLAPPHGRASRSPGALVLLVQQAVVMRSRRGRIGCVARLLIEYLPFVTMLLALYTAGGGVLLRGGPAGTPHGNTAMLALGMRRMGAVMGTTGASMVLIHPLLHANAHRRRKVHLVAVPDRAGGECLGSHRSAIRRSISACCTACRSSGRSATCSPRCWW